MKNVKIYEKKTKKLLGAFAKKGPQSVEEMDQAIAILIDAVLLENSTVSKATKAFDAICEEYVDFNDLRVSPAKEIHDCIGADYPQASVKAHALADVLRAVFYKISQMSREYLLEMQKRERLRHLQELGLSSFAISMLLLKVFATRAVPVDQDLADCLEMDGGVHPGSTLDQVDSFIGNLTSTLMGSTETTFYVLAVYFGAVGVQRVRHALATALTADLVGIMAAVAACWWLFGDV